MSVTPMGQLQRRVGLMLRAKVAGEDAPRKAAVIWDSPGDRWFTPADPIWRVHADAAMFPGGLAALLLQMLHPRAMAGVAGHSGYQNDPWGRLQRTSEYLAATTFGTVDHALATIDRVRQIHTRVRGKDEQGRAYSASDPDLLMWVHVAEIRSFLRAYQLFARTPLSNAEADRYVAQAAMSAEHLGVVNAPRSQHELRDVIDGYRPELHRSPAATEAARFLLVRPPLPWVARPGYAAIAAGAIAVLPSWARYQLGLPIPDHAARVVARPFGQLGTSTVRWAMAGIDDRARRAG